MVCHPDRLDARCHAWYLYVGTSTPSATTGASGAGFARNSFCCAKYGPLAYFTGPHPDTLVERLPSRKCGDGTQPPLYAPITAREHVELKVNAACAAADD